MQVASELLVAFERLGPRMEEFMKLSRNLCGTTAALTLLLGCFDTAMAQLPSLLVSQTSINVTVPAGGAPTGQNLTVSSSAGAITFTTSATTSSGGSWLTVSPATGTVNSNTPLTVTVIANPGGLATGAYQGTVTISSTGASNSPVQIAVTMNVTGANQLTVSSAALNFSAQVNGAAPPSQTLTVGTTGAPLNFTIQPQYPMGTSATWLTVTPTSGITGPSQGQVTVTASPNGLQAGNYSANLIVSATGAANSPVTVSVSFNVGATPALTITPTGALSFAYQVGGTLPPAQTLSLASTIAGSNFGYTVSASSAPNGWLVVTPLNGTTPGTVQVSIQPSGLPASTYNGTITVTPNGGFGSGQTINVTLLVSTNPLIIATPNTISFTAAFGGPAPASQTVQVTSTGGTLGFTVNATTSTGGTWLTATPLTGNTPQGVLLSANTSNLAPGTYNGAVTVTSGGAGNSPITIPVSITVSDSAVLTTTQSALIFNYQTTQAPPTGQTFTINSTGAPINFTASASVGTGCANQTWLTVTPTTGTTPSTIAASVNTAGLTNGTCTANIVITPAGSTSAALTIPVTLNISATALLNVTPPALTFNTTFGGAGTANGTLVITSTDPLSQLQFTATAATSTGGGWLAVGPAGSTPQNLSVLVNAGGLPAQSYQGSIQIQSSGLPSPLTVPVTLNVQPNVTASVSPTSLNFGQPLNGPAPPAQTLSITSSSGTLTYSAAATTQVGNWLKLSAPGGTTPGQLSASVDGSGLSQGTYVGTIVIKMPGASNTPLSINVTLVVGPAQSISADQTSLTFSYQQGTTAPAAQTINITSTGGSAPITVTVPSTAAWLSVTPTSGNTPVKLTASVTPGTLAAGSYNTNITVSSTAAATPITIPVTFTITATPLPLPTTVTNAASGQAGPISPGELITIKGSLLGPASPAVFKLNSSGGVDPLLSGTRVLFNGTPGTILYTSATQINAIVPYEVASLSTLNMVVEFQGQQSAPIGLRVADTAPGIFTVMATGSGQGSILNQNSTLNGTGNPAAKGSVIAIYATGEGVTNPPSTTGSVTGTVLKYPIQTVSVNIGGVDIKPDFAGSAPGIVSGVIQVNVRLPDAVPSGNQIVKLTIGANTSPATVTMVIQ